METSVNVDLSSLDPAALLVLLQSVSDEYTKRQDNTLCKVLLFVRTHTIELLDVDTTKSVRQFKEEVEEQSFQTVAGLTVPGPSAKWRYYHDDVEAVDDRSLATYVDEEEGAICFTVMEPKKRGTAVAFDRIKVVRIVLLFMMLIIQVDLNNLCYPSYDSSNKSS